MDNNLPTENLMELLDDIKSFAGVSGEMISHVSNDIPYLGVLSVTKNIWNYHKERKMKINGINKWKDFENEI